jgi:L-lactate dehydrogenase complex protein LldG
MVCPNRQKKIMTERENNNAVRQAMLASIRQHLATSETYDVVRAEHGARHNMKTESGRQAAVSPGPMSLVEMFSQSLEDVAGHCIVVHDESEAGQAIRRVMELTNAKRGAISDSTLVRRVIERVTFDIELLENPASADLFDCDVGITSAQWAIAETGTLVLEAEREHHRLASLVPPVHIALIEGNRIRRTMIEVLELLGNTDKDQLSRTVTFITGPSRTSDIELNLTIGVHGPGELYVIILEVS